MADSAAAAATPTVHPTALRAQQVGLAARGNTTVGAYLPGCNIDALQTGKARRGAGLEPGDGLKVDHEWIYHYDRKSFAYGHMAVRPRRH